MRIKPDGSHKGSLQGRQGILEAFGVLAERCALREKNCLNRTMRAL
jgi:hypothetical protein